MPEAALRARQPGSLSAGIVLRSSRAYLQRPPRTRAPRIRRRSRTRDWSLSETTWLKRPEATERVTAALQRCDALSPSAEEVPPFPPFAQRHASNNPLLVSRRDKYVRECIWTAEINDLDKNLNFQLQSRLHCVKTATKNTSCLKIKAPRIQSNNLHVVSFILQ